MNCKHFLLVPVFLWTLTSSNAQIIKGTVIDAQTRAPLPFANVFLNQTTKGTVTDGRGEFTLKLLHEPGSFELVVSFVGYEAYKASIVLHENEVLSAEIALKPEEKELANVTVQTSRDKNWEKQLKRFEKVFLGEDELADSCKILNPWVIDFVQNKSGKLEAFANGPIEIENRGMGYKLLFFLRFFWVERTSYFIAGTVQFEEMASMDEQQMLEWQINRKVSYLRSRHHLFKSMIDHQVKGEGFYLYADGGEGTDNLVRAANFSENLNKRVFPYDTTALVTPETDGNYRITLDKKVEVHYHQQKAQIRTYRDLPYPVSWIQFRSKSIVVNEHGYEVNPSDVTVSGDMSTDRVSRMLPLDYEPSNIVTLKDLQGDFLAQFREKIYVHTNKPYYYPGEPLWFKGYINYSTAGWRDSLSRTVYAELIDPEKELILSKTLEIKSGFFDNDFILPDSIKAGTYYLRAYTNFNRNFGDSSLFVRPIAVLGAHDRADPNQTLSRLEDDSTFVVFSDKRKYKPREKITLTLQSLADDGLPISTNLSLSVTDDQMIPIAEPMDIVRNFPFVPAEKIGTKELSFPIEYGVGFSGRFVNDAGKPEMTILNGIQFEPQNLFFAQSDEKGIFSVKELHFYDTAVFAIKSEKATTQRYGTVEWLPRPPAAMNFKTSPLRVQLLPIKGQKRVISEYEVPRDARLLGEVQIKATRLVQESSDRTRRPYGKPDYVLLPKDFNKGYGNLLLSLPGKVPGLVVRESTNDGQETKWVVYLQRSISIANPPEVIVTINDNFVTGNPAQILAALDPNIIESIEVKKGVNVLYGSYGGGGIVSIYTKTGLQPSSEKLPPNFQQIKVPGYATSHRFRSPDYSDPETDATQPDFRSCIYWNPNVVTDPKTGTAEVSFYAADIPGGYRIVAEGITSSGEPKRCEYFIQVER